MRPGEPRFEELGRCDLRLSPTAGGSAPSGSAVSQHASRPLVGLRSAVSRRRERCGPEPSFSQGARSRSLPEADARRASFDWSACRECSRRSCGGLRCQRSSSPPDAPGACPPLPPQLACVLDFLEVFGPDLNLPFEDLKPEDLEARPAPRARALALGEGARACARRRTPHRSTHRSSEPPRATRAPPRPKRVRLPPASPRARAPISAGGPAARGRHPPAPRGAPCRPLQGDAPAQPPGRLHGQDLARARAASLPAAPARRPVAPCARQWVRRGVNAAPGAVIGAGARRSATS